MDYKDKSGEPPWSGGSLVDVVGSVCRFLLSPLCFVWLNEVAHRLRCCHLRSDCPTHGNARHVPGIAADLIRAPMQRQHNNLASRTPRQFPSSGHSTFAYIPVL
jgi:hypothetical protein